jgi:hypothetical protein
MQELQMGGICVISRHYCHALSAVLPCFSARTCYVASIRRHELHNILERNFEMLLWCFKFCWIRYFSANGSDRKARLVFPF